MSGYRDAYYIKALKVRAKVIMEFRKAFDRVGAIAVPSMPIFAPRFDEVARLSPAETYAMDITTTARTSLACRPYRCLLGCRMASGWDTVYRKL